MDVKQSLQNIGEWAKKHPILAGGIVLILILIAWWVSKQGGGGLSMIAAPEAEASEAPSLGSFGAGGGSLLDTVANQSDGITQPAPVYDAPVFDALPSIPDMSNAGLFDPGSVQPEAFSALSTTSSVGTAITELVPGMGAQSAAASVRQGRKLVRPTEDVVIAPTGRTAKSAAKNKQKIKRPVDLDAYPEISITDNVMPKKKSPTYNTQPGYGERSATSRGFPVITRPTQDVVMPGYTGYLAGIYYYNGLPVSWMGTASGVANLTKPPVSGSGRTGR